jgi:2-amino-4-hydroxy-6-hydroxymethyldihydropteridine diphosphokinase
MAGAFKALCERLENARLSSLYRTSPLYVVDQPPFLNAAAVGDFSGDPLDLLAFANGIEARFGRDPALRNAARGERSLESTSSFSAI